MRLGAKLSDTQKPSPPGSVGIGDEGFTRCRHRPTLPRSLDRSTIGAAWLNDRVRDGNGCGPSALDASDMRVDVRAHRSYGWDTCSRLRGRLRASRALTTDREVILGGSSPKRGDPDVRMLCECCFGVAWSPAYNQGGVKPHGRLGQLRSERLAALPRAAYRRSSLLRPFRELKAPGRIHLGGRFPLRCFQRLSPPIIATRRCSWRHSRDTSGSSDSVLSY